jgi:hypothetical protein
MSYGFWFFVSNFLVFFHRKEKLFKIMFTYKSRIQKRKKESEKKLNEKKKERKKEGVCNLLDNQSF